MTNPDLEVLGEFIDQASQKIYTVHKRTRKIEQSPISGRKQQFNGAVDYITSCGIDLQPLNDQETRFELIQIDGILTPRAL
jgi:hypothetical protein